MHDELRAEQLYRALTSADDEASLALDDPELQDLAELGADLLRHGSELAMIAQAEQSFDAAFAKRLHTELVASHPAARQSNQQLDAADNVFQRHSQGVLDTTSGRTITGAADFTRRGVATAIHNVPAGARRLSRRAQRFLIAAIVLAAAVVALLSQTLLRPSTSSVPSASQASTQLPAAVAQRAIKAYVTGTPSPRVLGASKPSSTPGMHAFSAQSTAPAHGMASSTAPPGSNGSSNVARTPTSRQGVSPEPPGTDSLTNGALAARVVVPAPLPSLPKRVHAYSLRFTRLSVGAQQAIIASFSSLRQTRAQQPAANITSYASGSERLTLVPITGEVTYSLQQPSHGATLGHGGSLTPEAAAQAAQRWLMVHHLFQAGIDSSGLLVQMTAAGTFHVSYRPPRGLPPIVDSAIPNLTVDVNSAGKVVAAHRLWPSLEAAETLTLRALPKALQDLTTTRLAYQPGTVLQVGGVTLGYTMQGVPPKARLIPVYLVRGRSVRRGGAVTPFVQVVSAISK